MQNLIEPVDSYIDLEFAQFGWSDNQANNSINEFSRPKLEMVHDSSTYLKTLDKTIDEICCHFLFLTLFTYCLLKTFYTFLPRTLKPLNLLTTLSSTLQIKKYSDLNFFQTVKQ